MSRETVYIDLAGQKHPIRMTLRAAKELNARFGGMDNMAKVLTNNSDVDALLDALNDTLKILLKAGRCYESLIGTELPPPLPCDPIDVIDANTKETLATIMTAMRSDTEREVETVPKNGEATRDSQAPRGSTTTDGERD